jgi:hypothetical protein
MYPSLYLHDLIQSFCMPSCFKGSGKPDPHDLPGKVSPHNPSPDHQDVRVIVQPAHLCGEKIIAE